MILSERHIVVPNYYDLSSHQKTETKNILLEIQESDLQSGDLVRLRDGSYGILVKAPYIDRTVEINPKAVVDILMFNGSTHERIPILMVDKMQDPWIE